MFVFFLTILHPEMCVYVCFSTVFGNKNYPQPPPSSATFLLIDFFF